MSDSSYLIEDVLLVVDVVEKVPEKYQQAAFEILLRDVLQKRTVAKLPGFAASADSIGSESATKFPIKDSSAMRGFVSRTRFNPNVLDSVAMLEDGDLVFYRTPALKPKSRATIEWGLLLALKNGLINGEFILTKQMLRDTCKSQGCYDESNFASILRDVSQFFSGPLDDSQSKRMLTPDGEKALMELLERLKSS